MEYTKSWSTDVVKKMANTNNEVYQRTTARTTNLGPFACGHSRAGHSRAPHQELTFLFFRYFIMDPTVSHWCFSPTSTNSP